MRQAEEQNSSPRAWFAALVQRKEPGNPSLRIVRAVPGFSGFAAAALTGSREKLGSRPWGSCPCLREWLDSRCLRNWQRSRSEPGPTSPLPEKLDLWVVRLQQLAVRH